MGGANPFGVLAFAGYLLAMLLSWMAAVRFARVRPAGRAGDQARARTLTWALVGLSMLALALSKAFHVEAAITEHFRLSAEHGGWYEDRRSEQAIYLIAGLGFATPVLIGLLVLCRKAGEAALLAFGVALCLFVFVGLRMVSYHDVDAMLSAGVGQFRVSNMVELVGIVVIAVSAAASRPSSSWISSSVSSHRGRRRSR